MSTNPLASYFTQQNEADSAFNTSGTTDVAGRSFFEIIAECQDFSKNKVVSSDEDPFYDIWPMDETRPMDTLDNQQFNFALNEYLIDPIKQMVTKHLGPQEAAKRIFPNVDSVTCDENGLQILIKCGSYRSAVNLTNKILKNVMLQQIDANEGDKVKSIFTNFSLQIWFVRIALLMKLKLFREAELELKQFDDFTKTYLFYEHDRESQRKGSMVPFGLRMLNAELPLYLGKSEESISNLYKLLNIVEKIMSNQLPADNEKVQAIWFERKSKILFSIANILVYRKNYEKAINILKQLAESSHTTNPSVIWSCIGKIYLQIGDVKHASIVFQKSNDLNATSNDTSKKIRNLVDRSLLKIANGSYVEAQVLLKEAIELEPNNSTLINNMSFCLFYSGNLHEAIATIEKHIFASPNKHLNESLLFNLCTLYELESSRALQKKLKLLSLVNVHVGDGFYESCLQLQ